MIYDLGTPSYLALIISLLAIYFSGFKRPNSMVAMLTICVPFLLILLFSFESTRFAATDWPVYIKPDEYLRDSKFIGGDYLFWGPLFWFNENFDELYLHIFFKILSIFFFYIALRVVGISKTVSFYVTIIWCGTLSFFMATDWYLRQGFANGIFIIGFLGILYNNKNYNKLSKIYLYVLVMGACLLIHSGLIFLILVFWISYWCCDKLINIGNIFYKKNTYIYFKIIITMLIIAAASYVTTLMCIFYFGGYIPDYLYEYGGASPPISSVFLLFLLFYNTTFLIDYIKNEELKPNRSMIVTAIYFNIIIIFIIAISIGFSWNFIYLSRINTFKDIYVCIDLAFMFQILYNTSTKKLIHDKFKFIIFNISYLISINMYSLF